MKLYDVFYSNGSMDSNVTYQILDLLRLKLSPKE